MNEKVKACYENGVCPDCNQDIPEGAVEGDECTNCGHVFWLERVSEDVPGEDARKEGM